MIFQASGHSGSAVVTALYETASSALIERSAAASAAGADVLEWRLDYGVSTHAALSLDDVAAAIPQALDLLPHPLLLTLRTAANGGEADLMPGRYSVMLAGLFDSLMRLGVDRSRIGVDIEFSQKNMQTLVDSALDLGLTVMLSARDSESPLDPDVLQVMLEDLLEVHGVVPALKVHVTTDEEAQRALDVFARVRSRAGRPMILAADGSAARNVTLGASRVGSAATWARFENTQLDALAGEVSVEETLAFLASGSASE
ncbi:MAG: type I 3-dehydroquinate dehydratase [Actinomycetaceae bacterium]|nr:type I 3-dehydroquinate dehydratase [Actinomycetaceae bacterium]MDY6082347.1 type I 3-dehydroquinate dehydratase [Actinomycetaceae bacterium]